MADEPGGWELQRAVEKMGQDLTSGLAQINARLDKLVTTDVFAGEQRRVDDRLKDLADDIAHEREARVSALAEEKKSRQEGDKAQQSTIDKLTNNLKWIVVSLALPVALFIANIVMSRGA